MRCSEWTEPTTQLFSIVAVIMLPRTRVFLHSFLAYSSLEGMAVTLSELQLPKTCAIHVHVYMYLYIPVPCLVYKVPIYPTLHAVFRQGFHHALQ